MTVARLSIQADRHELASNIPAMLEAAGVDVEVLSLEVGDYFLPDGTIVERKGATDFGPSLLNGRIDDQLDQMESASGPRVLLIEGDDWVGDRVVRKPILGDFYYRLIRRNGTTAVYSPNPVWSAGILLELARLAAPSSAGPQGPIKRSAPTPGRFLAHLPGVGKEMESKIRKSFASFAEFATASEDELVSAVGPRPGRRLAAFLTSGWDVRTTDGRVGKKRGSSRHP